MTKQKFNRKQKRILRLIVSALLLVIGYLLAEPKTIGEVDSGVPPLILSNQCNDDLEETVRKSIAEAAQSVHLVIYTLTDQKIIDALNEKAGEGKTVTVLHDPSTEDNCLSPQVTATVAKQQGLMHQKILVIDGEKVWIGSANFTKESLRLHENLVVGLNSRALAKRILGLNREHRFLIGGQVVEFWDLPKEGKAALSELLAMLETAKKTIQVAMFTWTHPDLTEAIIRAHKRGLDVQIVMDRGQGKGVNEKAVKRLKKNGIPIRFNIGNQLLHHKFALIDGTVLACGSANWTRSAFSKNADCLLFIRDLSLEQQEKMKKIWHRTVALSTLVD